MTKGKVFVLGGTGFLGYYTILELLERGYEVKTAALPPVPEGLALPDDVELILGNVEDFEDHELHTLLSDCMGVMYAAGADERTVPEYPAKRFFYEANVRPTQRLARIARQAGVKKFVVFGSYFTQAMVDYPTLGLADQAYTSTRWMQEQVAFFEGEGAMDVTSLRLPMIFGTMPGRTPLWELFLDQIRGQSEHIVHRGVSSTVTAKQVGQAAVSAMEVGHHRETFAINTFTMMHADFRQLMIDLLGQRETTALKVVPYSTMADQYASYESASRDAGFEHGIHIPLSQKLSDMDIVTPPEETVKRLGLQEEDNWAVIEETILRAVHDHEAK